MPPPVLTVVSDEHVPPITPGDTDSPPGEDEPITLDLSTSLRETRASSDDLRATLSEFLRLAKTSESSDVPSMTNLADEKLNNLLTKLEKRFEKRLKKAARKTDKVLASYGEAIALRDEQIRRELTLRQESFRDEQAVRDKALDERFGGFLKAQSERDKALSIRVDAINEKLTAMSGEMSELRTSSKNWGMWVIATVVATALAVWLGVTQFNSSIASNVLTGFAIGSETAKKQSEMSKDIESLKRQDASKPVKSAD